jgi:arabinoxylan arabinofuranohydrolase
MMMKFRQISIVAFAFILILMKANAQNPIIQTRYTADPAPMVYNNTFYVYTGHDEAAKPNGWFDMKEWRCYSSTDMSNWTDLGSPMNLKTFSWGNVDAWASQCVYRNGKFYWYTCIRLEKDRFGIGVGVSDRPEGSFTDAIGKPLIAGDSYLDPTVFINDDGHAYMYFGNGKLWYVKLNQDMISTAGSIVEISRTSAAVDSYLEAPWLYKRNGLYYLAYAGQVPERENIRYSTSSSPTGTWEYRGVIMPEEGTSWTNHPGIADYKGNSYFVYHNGALQGGGNGHRSVCVEQFKYNADGTIPTMKMTTTGSEQIGTLNPYIRHEAEEICWEEGVKTETSSQVGVYVTSIESGDYIKVKGVDFGKGAKRFFASVASGSNGGNIEIRTDSISGPLLGTCLVQNTGDWQNWVTQKCAIKKSKGIHDLYFVFKGGESKLFNFDYWKFK